MCTFAKMVHCEFTLSTSLPLEPTMSQGINILLLLHNYLHRYDCGTWAHSAVEAHGVSPVSACEMKNFLIV